MKMKNGDLISRSALLESMNAVVFRNVPVEHQLYVQEACKAFESAVKDAPAVDAEPVRRGQWIEDRTRIICPACKTEYSDEIVYMNLSTQHHKIKYCPDCGANMEVSPDAERTD